MRKERQPIRVWAIIFWLIVWQLAAMALHAAYPHGALLLPSPLAALARLMALAGTAAFWRAIGTSSMHILGGFLLSCALAVVLAAFSARFSRVKELLAPLVAAVKTVPVASFIILALIWLSSRTLPLFIAALMVFPPVYLNVLEGIRRTDASLLEMARVFRVPVFAHAAGRVSAAGASLLPLCRQCGAGLCWKAGTAAEVIALSSGSIGEKLYNAKIYFQTADLFAWTAAIVLISAAFEKLFLLLVDKIAERMGA